MRTVHIVNPAAGKGKAADYVSAGRDDIVHTTTAAGDAESFVKQCLSEGGEYQFNTYGGDGTVNEVVNGIMASGRSDSARLHIIPVGSGNDFIRCFDGKKGDYPIDLIRCNGRYSANMLNIGFDCSVVAKTAYYKKLPFVNGSFAYVLGVADILCHRLGEPFRVTLTDSNGNITRFDSGEYLLCFIANGMYCGGGFKGAPLALLNDGLLDVMVVNKITRRRFISLVGDYKRGTHINPSTMRPIDSFSSCITYTQCKSVGITGMKQLCSDGEVTPVSEITVDVVPSAITIRV